MKEDNLKIGGIYTDNLDWYNIIIDENNKKYFIYVFHIINDRELTKNLSNMSINQHISDTPNEEILPNIGFMGKKEELSLDFSYLGQVSEKNYEKLNDLYKIWLT